MNPLIEYLRAGTPVLLRSFFWPMLWQSSLLIAVLFVIDLAFRRHLRPAVRYCMWLIVFLKLLLPPSLALPTSLAWWLRPTTDAPAPTRIVPLVVTYGQVVRPEPLPARPAISASTISPLLPAAAWFVLASAGISLALIAWMGLRWWQIARCVNQATPVSEPLLELLAETSRCVGFSRPVGLRLTDTPISPAVCGFVRPVILLPRSLAERLPNPRLRAVLLHELAHLRRHDVWVNCAQALLQAAYWWHPLLWLANARVRRLREEAVDDAVMVALAHEADTYAPTLLEVAKLALARPLASLGLVGILEGRHALRRRIERLVDFQTPRRSGLTLASTCCVFGLAALAVPMGEAPRKPAQDTARSASDPIGWPDPRLEGYGKVELQERFLLVDQTRLREVLPTLTDSDQPLAFAPNRRADIEQKLQQAQAEPYADSEPLTFEKFSGGQFHYRIGGTTSNSVNYLTRGEAVNRVRVFGADVAFAATARGWTPLDLTLVPRTEPEGISCELGFYLANETNSARQAQVTIPFGGVTLWAIPEGTAVGKYQLVVLQEMTVSTNLASPAMTANALAPTTRELEASSLLKDGRLLYEEGRLDESAAKLNQSLMANSNNPSAHFYLGLVAAARAASNRNSAVVPTNSAKVLANTLVQNGKLLYEMGKFDQAKKALRDALSQDPQNQAAYYYLNLVQEANNTNALQQQGGALTNSAPKTNLEDKIPLHTRTFKVDPNTLVQSLASEVHKPETLPAMVRDFFVSIGVEFDQGGKTFFFNDHDGRLLVHASLQDLDTIERAVAKLNTPPLQINIRTKFIEIPANWETEFWSLVGVTNLEQQNISRLLTPAQAQIISAKIEAAPGVNLLAQPSVTTLDGRQCEMQVVDIMTIVTNFNPKALTPPGVSSPATGGNEAYVSTATVPFGPTLDIIPQVSGNGLQIELATTASVTEFLGYEKPKKKTPIFIDGRKHLETQPLPKFRVRKITNQTTVPDGYSLLLGKPVDETGLDAEKTADGKKRLLVLITPTLIDPAGNRVHPEPNLQAPK